MPVRLRAANGKFAHESVETRFWKSVDRTGGPDACWPWTGAKRTRKGYGSAWDGERSVSAHRLAYQLANGDTGDGLLVCHECDNPPCCNPKHLFEGTVTDNSDDKVRKGRHARGATHGFVLHPERVARGERAGKAKLKEAEVLTIRRLVAGGRSMRSVAFAYNVHPSTVQGIVKYRYWRFLAATKED